MTFIKISRIENISSKNLYFLGSWSYSFDNEIKYGIDYLKKNTQAHPWSNFQILNQDKEYLYELYERLLIPISQSLNNFHQTKYSKRYWEIIIGHWLHMFTFINLDQWRVVEKCLTNSNDNLVVQEFNIDEFKIIPESIEHCKKIYLSDNWRQHNFVKIFKYFDEINYLNSKINFKISEFKEIKKNKNLKNNFSIKTNTAIFFNKIFKKKLKNQKYFIARSYLGKVEETKLNLMLHQLPYLSIPNLTNLNILPDKNLRSNFKIHFKPKNEFEKYLLKILNKQIPLSFLEGYEEIGQQLNELSFPDNPKIIFTTNFLYKSFITRYCAEKTERGAKLIHGQHGGCYGQLELHWHEYFEKKISDKYLTWGWMDESSGNKISPIGIIRPLPKIRKKNFNNKKFLLMLIGCKRQHVVCVDSKSGSQRNYNHLENCNLIINQINSEIQNKNLLLRLPMNLHDGGWNEHKRFNFFSKYKK